MADFFKKLLRISASAKITVGCLLALATLIIWGTLFEASDGIFAARERFFQSWFFFTKFNIPFPGLKLVSLILVVNLLSGSVQIIRKPLRNSGLILIHTGIIFIFTGVLFSSTFTREYFIPLQEGDTVSSVYSTVTYEIAVIKRMSSQPDSWYTSDSVSIKNVKSGQVIQFPNSGIQCKVKSVSRLVDDEKNPYYQVPLTLEESCSSQMGKDIVLNSGEMPVAVQCDPELLYLSLRPVSIPIPFSLQLIDFSKKFHPGTEMLKEVSSHVSIHSDRENRDAIISMNRPLRAGSFTFYQASYSHQGDKEISNLSVIYNPHRLFPYIASFLLIGGLLVHLVVGILGSAGVVKLDVKNGSKSNV